MNRVRALVFAQKQAQSRFWLWNSVMGQHRSIIHLAGAEKSLPNYKTPNRIAFMQLNRYSSEVNASISQLDYEQFCVETLDDLTDYIEELVESVAHLEAADVVNKDGVLTISLGSKYGTYVINKQTPNKQIWLSSPTSGPKRFDFVYASNDNQNGHWTYKHTGVTLHELLDKEFTEILNKPTKFCALAFGEKC